MKRLIFLKVEYLDLEAKKISKAKEQELREGLCKDSVKLFKNQMKDWLADKKHKITKEYLVDIPQVLVEFPDAERDDAYDALRKSDIVESIDSYLPLGEV